LGLAVVQGDLKQAVHACEQAAALFRQAGDSTGLVHALHHLGLAAIATGIPDRAETLLEESLHHARLAGDQRLEGFGLFFLTAAAMAQGDYERAVELSAQCEAVLRQTGDPEGLGWALVARGAAAWCTDDYAGAAQWLREGLRIFHGVGHRWGLSVGLFHVAQLMGRRGDHLQMAVLFGASEALRQSVGAALQPFRRVWLNAAVTQAKITLGSEKFDRAWQAGQAMAPDAAFTEAMQELDRWIGPPPRSAEYRPPPAPEADK
jgi:ATP/maltotriose-dependent transcriptional regulator MalT